MAERNYIFDTIKSVFKTFGYAQIDTPAMENLSTLLGKYGEEGDKLLCYGDAVNILSARLAQSSAYDFDCASLEYVLTAPYSKEYCEQAVYNDGSQFMSFYEELYLHMDNNKEYLRPCWVFRDFSKNYEGTTEWFHGGIYLVDALTGEVFIY